SLSITDSTVKFHAKNLLKKTGCANRKELIVMYRRVVPQ
ncbi:MAG: response regulator transcription factor, partial [Pseudobutyrivibrio sp.]|nr:response regulator transcription factor [Pseudobutyrivibrio sp.]